MNKLKESLESLLQKFSSSRSGRILFFLVLTLGAHSNLLFPKFTENPDSSKIYSNLIESHSVIDYLRSLFNFTTVDFQPVRDLTFYFDIWSFDQTGILFGIFLNCLIWVVICYNLVSILQLYVPSVPLHWALLLVATLSVNPIYSQTINWIIARKHLLAVMFTLFATKNFFLYLEGKASEFRIIIFYTLSLLSLPASVLWPIWAALHLKLHGKLDRKQATTFLIPLFFIMLLLIGINFAYYNTSYTFLELYPKKSSTRDPVMMMMLVGQMFAQVIFPYYLNFYNLLGTKALIGFVGFLIFIGWVLFRHRKNPRVLTWIFFSGAHLVIFLSTPNIYYDSYVLFPSIGLFLILVISSERNLQKIVYFLPVLLGIWLTTTFVTNPIWGSTVKFFKSSFENQPGCSNALGYATGIYLEGRKIPNEIYDYIQVNECMTLTKDDTPGVKIRKFTFESILLFYEDEIDFDYRERRFKELSRMHFYPMSIYMAFLTKYQKNDEIERLAFILNKQFESTDTKIMYDSIFMKTVPEYCKRHNLNECLRYVEHWKTE